MINQPEMVVYLLSMIKTILLTVLSTQLVFSQPTFSSIPTKPHVVFTQVLPDENYVSYSVEKNDTLKSISFAYYGTQDYWTALQQANVWISDPENLPEGRLLNIPVVLTDKSVQSTSSKTSVASTYAYVQTAPKVTVSDTSTSISNDALTYLGNCEAGMNPARNSGNGYYGAFQFSYGTWKSMNTGYDRADLAPLEVQEVAVKQLLKRSSIYSQFPGCARKMHSVGLI